MQKNCNSNGRTLATKIARPAMSIRTETHRNRSQLENDPTPIFGSLIRVQRCREEARWRRTSSAFSRLDALDRAHQSLFRRARVAHERQHKDHPHKRNKSSDKYDHVKGMRRQRPASV